MTSRNILTLDEAFTLIKKVPAERWNLNSHWEYSALIGRIKVSAWGKESGANLWIYTYNDQDDTICNYRGPKVSKILSHIYKKWRSENITRTKDQTLSLLRTMNCSDGLIAKLGGAIK